jgi:Ca2+-binding EF-hand superfamily protein
MLSISRATLALTLALLTLPALAAGGKLQKHMLDKMDANKDGVITLDEFQPRGQDRMTKADTDHDGAISMAEMRAQQSEKIAEHQARMAERMAGMEEKFATMDIDKDGKITPNEARQAAFNRMDINQDGQLSADELRRPGSKKGHRRHDEDYDDAVETDIEG